MNNINFDLERNDNRTSNTLSLSPGNIFDLVLNFDRNLVGVCQNILLTIWNNSLDPLITSNTILNTFRTKMNYSTYWNISTFLVLARLSNQGRRVSHPIRHTAQTTASHRHRPHLHFQRHFQLPNCPTLNLTKCLHHQLPLQSIVQRKCGRSQPICSSKRCPVWNIGPALFRHLAENSALKAFREPVLLGFEQPSSWTRQGCWVLRRPGYLRCL